MLSHITVGSHDLERAANFYDALLAPLGWQRPWLSPTADRQRCAGWPRFYVYRPFNGEPASAVNGSMVVFLAQSNAAVDAAHAQGLAHGGRDEGAPGPRPRYAHGYYGAYLRDPDGNKLHIVHRADIRAMGCSQQLAG